MFSGYTTQPPTPPYASLSDYSGKSNSLYTTVACFVKLYSAHNIRNSLIPVYTAKK